MSFERQVGVEDAVSEHVEDWHTVIGDPNQADAICDRLLHHAHRIDLQGRSMRDPQVPGDPPEAASE